MELIALSLVGTFALIFSHGLMVVRQRLRGNYRHILRVSVFNAAAQST